MQTTTYTTDCECCGQAGAREVAAPSGGTMEACRRCERYEWRQAAIDALDALS
ncbi:hypothetical protein [Micromonospora sp. NBRC 101691]|uniref:hypothetical protein n=1 Tax=Micromonospora sp. NBRC 101691 TaxID=3032198 RepID=UPI0024A5A84E|nr:hypothetical protein [Micromonospora sp. NBRC 101691]GLY21712.1 hypothetical protein Misp04_14440 [Micromonospora sp. NBRC 101691]